MSASMHELYDRPQIEQVEPTYLNRPVKRETVIGAAIRAWRTGQRMSQSALARLLRVDHSFVSRVENGTRSFHHTQIPALSTLLGIPEIEVALMICGYDPTAYRQEIEREIYGRIMAVMVEAA